jgi:hypothetical protein
MGVIHEETAQSQYWKVQVGSELINVSHKKESFGGTGDIFFIRKN